MTNLIIKDLAESRELDRHAMTTVLGGIARGLLFSFPLARKTSVPGITNIFNITNNLTQFVADTLQLNILNQNITITDSPGAIAENLGGQENSSLKEFAAIPAS